MISPLTAGSVDGGTAMATYRRWRIAAALRPFTPDEEDLAKTASRILHDRFHLDRQLANTESRRHILYQREVSLHQTMLLDLPPAALNALLDDVAVAGEQVLKLRPDSGVLLVSVHFWLYSSWLWLWLMRAAHRGQLPSLSIVIESKTGFGLPQERLDAWQQADMYSPETSRLLDSHVLGRTSVARKLLGALRSKGAVLVFPDVLGSPPHKRGSCAALGAKTCAFSDLQRWLVARTGCSQMGVHIEPRGASHAVVFHSPPKPDLTQADPSDRLLQHLLNATTKLRPGIYAALTQLASGQ